MSSLVHVSAPADHPKVVRAKRAAGSIKRAAADLVSPRGTASLLLAAIVSALMVVANQVIDTWSDGHLLLAWIVLWTVAFTTLALAARPARAAARRARVQLRRWNAARRAAAQDDRMWQVALTDARVMADISRAMDSHAGVGERRYF